MEAVNETFLLHGRRVSRRIGWQPRVVDCRSDRIEAFGSADHGLVDGFGTPDEVGAIFECEEARREFAGADHWCENDFVAVVDSIFGNGDAFGRDDHGGDDSTESTLHRYPTSPLQ